MLEERGQIVNPCRLCSSSPVSTIAVRLLLEIRAMMQETRPDRERDPGARGNIEIVATAGDAP